MPRPGTRRAFTATTTISVLRVPALPDDELRDGEDQTEPEQIDSLVPASIGTGRSREDRDAGNREADATRLVCDITDLRHTDLIVDETTGVTWALTSTVVDYRLGLDYMAADLQRVTGAG